jgi:hypothetical protein
MEIDCEDLEGNICKISRIIEKYIVNNCGEHFRSQHDNMEFNGGKWEKHLWNQLDTIKI